MRNKINQRGQALIEMIIAIPTLVALLGTLVLSLAVFSLRMHFVFLTQELASCALSTKPRFECELRTETQGRELLLHWGFQNVSVQASMGAAESTLHLRATWDQSPLRLPLRWNLRESPPFQAPER